MIITVDKTGPRNSDKLEQAARFFAAQLMDPRMVRKIRLDIEIERNLDVEGQCVSEDDHKSPRWFTIQLRRQKIGEMIKTLAHEMVHVKQYAKNELGKEMALARGGKKGVRIVTRWQGDLWYPKAKEHDYYDAPWEIEAYGREVGLWAKWLAANGHYDLDSE